MRDYNRISHETLAFLEYAKAETPKINFKALINPAEETVTVYAQKITSVVLRREQRYTFEEFLMLSFESIHKSLLLKF